MEEIALMNDGLEGLSNITPDERDPVSDMGLMIRGLDGFAAIWQISQAANVPADQQGKRFLNQMHLMREHPSHHHDRTLPGTATRSLRRLAERTRESMVRQHLRRALGDIAERLTDAQWDALDLIAGRLASFAIARAEAVSGDAESMARVGNNNDYLNVAIGEAFRLYRSPFHAENTDIPQAPVKNALGILAYNIEQMVPPDRRIPVDHLPLIVQAQQPLNLPAGHTAAAHYDKPLSNAILSSLVFSLRAVSTNEVPANKEPYFNTLQTLNTAQHLADCLIYGAAASQAAQGDSMAKDTLEHLGNPRLGSLLVSYASMVMRERGRKNPGSVFSLDVQNDETDREMLTAIENVIDNGPKVIVGLTRGVASEAQLALPAARRAQFGGFLADIVIQHLHMDPATDAHEIALLNKTLAQGLRYDTDSRPAPQSGTGALYTFAPRKK